MCYSANRQEAFALHFQARSDVYVQQPVHLLRSRHAAVVAAALDVVKICRRQQ
jgi:hypothetical protein